MADVNVTDLTQETYSTLDGTEQVIMFDSAEGKRATVAAVGEYVLKKLTTSLNGSTQTVANALSSLNSDKADASSAPSINGTGTAIASGGDLNNLTSTGTYFATSNAIASSLSNSPVTKGFVMYVIDCTGGGLTTWFGGMQLLLDYKSNIYIRWIEYNRSTGYTFGSWFKITTSAAS